MKRMLHTKNPTPPPLVCSLHTFSYEIVILRNPSFVCFYLKNLLHNSMNSSKGECWIRRNLCKRHLIMIRISYTSQTGWRLQTRLFKELFYTLRQRKSEVKLAISTSSNFWKHLLSGFSSNLSWSFCIFHFPNVF